MEIRRAASQKRIGGELCLDFANTLNGHHGNPLHEYLTDYKDFVLWCQHSGLLTASEAKARIRKVRRFCAECLKTYKRIIALRETI